MAGDERLAKADEREAIGKGTCDDDDADAKGTVPNAGTRGFGSHGEPQ
jgi:hypothetical protein